MYKGGYIGANLALAMSFAYTNSISGYEYTTVFEIVFEWSCVCASGDLINNEYVNLVSVSHILEFSGIREFILGVIFFYGRRTVETDVFYGKQMATQQFL